MTITERLRTIDTYLKFGERIVNWGPLVVGSAGAGALVGWAGWAPQSLSAYAPLSWVMCVMIGILISAMIYWLWALAKLRIARTDYAKSLATQTHYINPLDQVFTGLRINVNAFKTPFPENIQSKTFVDCEIYGPAVLLFNGYTTLDRGGMVSCDFVKVKTGKENPIYNAIAFENITLRNCRLFNMTVLIPDYLVGSIPTGANWITP